MLPIFAFYELVPIVKPVTRTVHLVHLLPSRVSERLLDPRATHPLGEALEQLSPDDIKKTITLKGSAEAVELVEQAIHWLDVPTPKMVVEVEAEIVGSSKEVIRGRALMNTDACGTLVLSGMHSHLILQIVPHLNRNKTCSLAISATYQKQTNQSRFVIFNGSSELLSHYDFSRMKWYESSEGRLTSKITSLKFVPLGKTLKLEMGTLGGIMLGSTEKPYMPSRAGRSISLHAPLFSPTPISLVEIMLKITPRLK